MDGEQGSQMLLFFCLMAKSSEICMCKMDGTTDFSEMSDFNPVFFLSLNTFNHGLDSRSKRA